MQKKIYVLIFLSINFLLVNCASSQFMNFVTRKADKLYDGERQVRFISFNIPNLHYLEDYLPFDGTNPWRLPEEFEIRDALKSIKQMGGKVARIYVLSVRREDDKPEYPRHVEGPGKFNEEAFKTLDKVMQIANEEGVRIIIPFVDNWHWWGGPREYSAFRNKPKDAFWTDSQIISDFKQTINFLINRKNTFTGVIYKDDKALFAWETGNELAPPYSWTKEIAAYIKSLDQNHLLLEGIIAKDLSQEAIDDPNLDILSTHHYGDPKVSISKIVANQKMVKGKKPYIVGEYGIVPTQDIRVITDTIINQDLAGGMLWSLRFRNKEGGFYHHFEYNNIESYRWPGFNNGEFYDEKTILNLAREKAYQIDGTPMPRIPAPEAPKLLEMKNVSEISWQGSTGARAYKIERKEEYDDEWKVIADDVDDSKYQYRPLFNDESAEIGKRYYYRIVAKNESGESGYSNIIGPIDVTYKKITDEMENFNNVFQKDGELQLLTTEDLRKAKEDRSRLTGLDGSYLIYKVPANAFSVLVDAFVTKDSAEINMFGGESLDSLSKINSDKKLFTFGKNDYGFFDAVRYSSLIMKDGIKFIKIQLAQGMQISRIEISYK